MSEVDDVVYRVVVNHEEQYSIWPAGRDLPPGWREAGKSGAKAECLAHIEEVWTDMRPLSLRKAMERAATDRDSGRPAAVRQVGPQPRRRSRRSPGEGESSPRRSRYARPVPPSAGSQK